MADDDLDDQYLVRRAVEEIDLRHQLHTVNNGSQLIERLRLPEPKPDCILLDLNMPLVDGFQALNFIKSRKEMSAIPVYVLSTSRSQADRERSLLLGAVAFYVKPTQFGELRQIVQEICAQARAFSGAEQYNPS